MRASNLEIKRLTVCSLTDAVTVWNEGFSDYFVDLTLTAESYLARLRNEGLSQAHSLIAFVDGNPAGFLLNGIREAGGMKLAWNGGTGVSPKFRKRGVGKALVQAAIGLYREEGVELATLEAISNNEPAIALYRKFGYEVVDRLIFLRHEGQLDSFTSASQYMITTAKPEQVGELDFYLQSSPWQAQWQNMLLDGGEAAIVADREGVDVGYALCRKKIDADGNLQSIALHQCEVRPDRTDTPNIARVALDHVFAPLRAECLRTTANLRMSNELVLGILKEASFTTFVEQVQMSRRMD